MKGMQRFQDKKDDKWDADFVFEEKTPSGNIEHLEISRPKDSEPNKRSQFAAEKNVSFSNVNITHVLSPQRDFGQYDDVIPNIGFDDLLDETEQFFDDAPLQMNPGTRSKITFGDDIRYNLQRFDSHEHKTQSNFELELEVEAFAKKRSEMNDNGSPGEDNDDWDQEMLLDNQETMMDFQNDQNSIAISFAGMLGESHESNTVTPNQRESLLEFLESSVNKTILPDFFNMKDSSNSSNYDSNKTNYDPLAATTTTADSINNNKDNQQTSLHGISSAMSMKSYYETEEAKYLEAANQHLKGLFEWIDNTTHSLKSVIFENNSNNEVNAFVLLNSEIQLVHRDLYFMDRILERCEEQPTKDSNIYAIEVILKWLRGISHVYKHKEAMKSSHNIPADLQQTPSSRFSLLHPQISTRSVMSTNDRKPEVIQGITYEKFDTVFTRCDYLLNEQSNYVTSKIIESHSKLEAEIHTLIVDHARELRLRSIFNNNNNNNNDNSSISEVESKRSQHSSLTGGSYSHQSQHSLEHKNSFSLSIKELKKIICEMFRYLTDQISLIRIFIQMFEIKIHIKQSTNMFQNLETIQEMMDKLDQMHNIWLKTLKAYLPEASTSRATPSGGNNSGVNTPNDTYSYNNAVKSLVSISSFTKNTTNDAQQQQEALEYEERIRHLRKILASEMWEMLPQLLHPQQTNNNNNNLNNNNNPSSSNNVNIKLSEEYTVRGYNQQHIDALSKVIVDLQALCLTNKLLIIADISPVNLLPMVNTPGEARDITYTPPANCIQKNKAKDINNKNNNNSSSTNTKSNRQGTNSRDTSPLRGNNNNSNANSSSTQKKNTVPPKPVPYYNIAHEQSVGAQFIELMLIIPSPSVTRAKLSFAAYQYLIKLHNRDLPWQTPGKYQLVVAQPEEIIEEKSKSKQKSFHITLSFIENIFEKAQFYMEDELTSKNMEKNIIESFSEAFGTLDNTRILQLLLFEAGVDLFPTHGKQKQQTPNVKPLQRKVRSFHRDVFHRNTSRDMTGASIMNDLSILLTPKDYSTLKNVFQHIPVAMNLDQTVFDLQRENMLRETSVKFMKMNEREREAFLQNSSSEYTPQKDRSITQINTETNRMSVFSPGNPHHSANISTTSGPASYTSNMTVNSTSSFTLGGRNSIGNSTGANTAPSVSGGKDTPPENSLRSLGSPLMTPLFNNTNVNNSNIPRPANLTAEEEEYQLKNFMPSRFKNRAISYILRYELFNFSYLLFSHLAKMIVDTSPNATLGLDELCIIILGHLNKTKEKIALQKETTMLAVKLERHDMAILHGNTVLQHLQHVVVSDYKHISSSNSSDHNSSKNSMNMSMHSMKSDTTSSIDVHKSDQNIPELLFMTNTLANQYCDNAQHELAVKTILSTINLLHQRRKYLDERIEHLSAYENDNNKDGTKKTLKNNNNKSKNNNNNAKKGLNEAPKLPYRPEKGLYCNVIDFERWTDPLFLKLGKTFLLMGSAERAADVLQLLLLGLAERTDDIINDELKICVLSWLVEVYLELGDCDMCHRLIKVLKEVRVDKIEHATAPIGTISPTVGNSISGQISPNGRPPLKINHNYLDSSNIPSPEKTHRANRSVFFSFSNVSMNNVTGRDSIGGGGGSTRESLRMRQDSIASQGGNNNAFPAQFSRNSSIASNTNSSPKKNSKVSLKYHLNHPESNLPKFCITSHNTDLGDLMSRVYFKSKLYVAALKSLTPTIIGVELIVEGKNGTKEGMLELGRLYYLRGKIQYEASKSSSVIKYPFEVGSSSLFSAVQLLSSEVRKAKVLSVNTSNVTNRNKLKFARKQEEPFARIDSIQSSCEISHGNTQSMKTPYAAAHNLLTCKRSIAYSCPSDLLWDAMKWFRRAWDLFHAAGDEISAAKSANYIAKCHLLPTFVPHVFFQVPLEESCNLSSYVGEIKLNSSMSVSMSNFDLVPRRSLATGKSVPPAVSTEMPWNEINASFDLADDPQSRKRQRPILPRQAHREATVNNTSNNNMNISNHNINHTNSMNNMALNTHSSSDNRIDPTGKPSAPPTLASNSSVGGRPRSLPLRQSSNASMSGGMGPSAAFQKTGIVSRYASIEEIQRVMQFALEVSVESCIPLVIIDSYLNMAELKMLQGITHEAVTHWLEARELLLFMFADGALIPIIRRASLHFTEKLFGIFNRFIRFLWACEQNVVNKNLFLLDMQIILSHERERVLRKMQSKSRGVSKYIDNIIAKVMKKNRPYSKNFSERSSISNINNNNISPIPTPSPSKSPKFTFGRQSKQDNSGNKSPKSTITDSSGLFVHLNNLAHYAHTQRTCDNFINFLLRNRYNLDDSDRLFYINMNKHSVLDKIYDFGWTDYIDYNKLIAMTNYNTALSLMSKAQEEEKLAEEQKEMEKEKLTANQSGKMKKPTLMREISNRAKSLAFGKRAKSVRKEMSIESPTETKPDPFKFLQKVIKINKNTGKYTILPEVLKSHILLKGDLNKNMTIYLESRARVSNGAINELEGDDTDEQQSISEHDHDHEHLDTMSICSSPSSLESPAGHAPINVFSEKTTTSGGGSSQKRSVDSMARQSSTSNSFIAKRIRSNQPLDPYNDFEWMDEGYAGYYTPNLLNPSENTVTTTIGEASIAATMQYHSAGFLPEMPEYLIYLAHSMDSPRSHARLVEESGGRTFDIPENVEEYLMDMDRRAENTMIQRLWRCFLVIKNAQKCYQNRRYSMDVLRQTIRKTLYNETLFMQRIRAFSRQYKGTLASYDEVSMISRKIEPPSFVSRSPFGIQNQGISFEQNDRESQRVAAVCLSNRLPYFIYLVHIGNLILVYRPYDGLQHVQLFGGSGYIVFSNVFKPITPPPPNNVGIDGLGVEAHNSSNYSLHNSSAYSLNNSSLLNITGSSGHNSSNNNLHNTLNASNLKTASNGGNSINMHVSSSNLSNATSTINMNFSTYSSVSDVSLTQLSIRAATKNTDNNSNNNNHRQGGPFKQPSTEFKSPNIYSFMRPSSEEGLGADLSRNNSQSPLDATDNKNISPSKSFSGKLMTLSTDSHSLMVSSSSCNSFSDHDVSSRSILNNVTNTASIASVTTINSPMPPISPRRNLVTQTTQNKFTNMSNSTNSSASAFHTTNSSPSNSNSNSMENMMQPNNNNNGDNVSLKSRSASPVLINPNERPQSFMMRGLSGLIGIADTVDHNNNNNSNNTSINDRHDISNHSGNNNNKGPKQQERKRLSPERNNKTPPNTDANNTGGKAKEGDGNQFNSDSNSTLITQNSWNPQTMKETINNISTFTPPFNVSLTEEDVALLFDLATKETNVECSGGKTNRKQLIDKMKLGILNSTLNFIRVSAMLVPLSPKTKGASPVNVNNNAGTDSVTTSTKSAYDLTYEANRNSISSVSNVSADNNKLPPTVSNTNSTSTNNFTSNSNNASGIAAITSVPTSVSATQDKGLQAHNTFYIAKSNNSLSTSSIIFNPTAEQVQSNTAQQSCNDVSQLGADNNNASSALLMRSEESLNITESTASLGSVPSNNSGSTSVSQFVSSFFNYRRFDSQSQSGSSINGAFGLSSSSNGSSEAHHAHSLTLPPLQSVPITILSSHSLHILPLELLLGEVRIVRQVTLLSQCAQVLNKQIDAEENLSPHSNHINRFSNTFNNSTSFYSNKNLKGDNFAKAISKDVSGDIIPTLSRDTATQSIVMDSIMLEEINNVSRDINNKTSSDLLSESNKQLQQVQQMQQDYNKKPPLSPRPSLKKASLSPSKPTTPSTVDNNVYKANKAARNSETTLVINTDVNGNPQPSINSLIALKGILGPDWNQRPVFITLSIGNPTHNNNSVIMPHKILLDLQSRDIIRRTSSALYHISSILHKGDHLPNIVLNQAYFKPNNLLPLPIQPNIVGGSKLYIETISEYHSTVLEGFQDKVYPTQSALIYDKKYSSPGIKMSNHIDLTLLDFAVNYKLSPRQFWNMANPQINAGRKIDNRSSTKSMKTQADESNSTGTTTVAKKERACFPVLLLTYTDWIELADVVAYLQNHRTDAVFVFAPQFIVESLAVEIKLSLNRWCRPAQTQVNAPSPTIPEHRDSLNSTSSGGNKELKRGSTTEILKEQSTVDLGSYDNSGSGSKQTTQDVINSYDSLSISRDDTQDTVVPDVKKRSMFELTKSNSFSLMNYITSSSGSTKSKPSVATEDAKYKQPKANNISSTTLGFNNSSSSEEPSRSELKSKYSLLTTLKSMSFMKGGANNQSSLLQSSSSSSFMADRDLSLDLKDSIDQVEEHKSNDPAPLPTTPPPLPMPPHLLSTAAMMLDQGSNSNHSNSPSGTNSLNNSNNNSNCNSNSNSNNTSMYSMRRDSHENTTGVINSNNTIINTGIATLDTSDIANSNLMRMRSNSGSGGAGLLLPLSPLTINIPPAEQKEGGTDNNSNADGKDNVSDVASEISTNVEVSFYHNNNNNNSSNNNNIKKKTPPPLPPSVSANIVPKGRSALIKSQSANQTSTYNMNMSITGFNSSNSMNNNSLNNNNNNSSNNSVASSSASFINNSNSSSTNNKKQKKSTIKLNKAMKAKDRTWVYHALMAVVANMQEEHAVPIVVII